MNQDEMMQLPIEELKKREQQAFEDWQALKSCKEFRGKVRP